MKESLKKIKKRREKHRSPQQIIFLTLEIVSTIRFLIKPIESNLIFYSDKSQSDKMSGLLTATGEKIGVGSSVCLKFVAVS